MLWGVGVAIVVIALLGFWVERMKWGRNPEVHIAEILFLCAVPIGATVTILGLILEVHG